MNTIRTNIINCLTADLMNIQISNGYLNDMKLAKNGALLPEQVSMFPSCGFLIESDEPSEYLTEDLNLQVRKLGITIAVYTNEENKVLAIENMIADLNKLFKDDNSILPIYQSQINQIDGTWSDGKNRCVNITDINQINDAGIIIYKLSIYYLSEYNGNANGFSDLPIIPKILDEYTLTSTTQALQNQVNAIAISGANVWGTITGNIANQTDLTNAITSSLTGINLSNYSLSGHSHTVIPNNLLVNDTFVGRWAQGSNYMEVSQKSLSGGYDYGMVQHSSGATYLGGGNISLYANDDIKIGYNTTKSIYVLKAGNVGINNDTPTEKLSVSGNISASGSITAVGSVDINNYGTSPVGSGYKVGGQLVLARNSGEVYMGNYGNSDYMWIGSDRSIKSMTQGVARMIVISSGLVGIGTTTPVTYDLVTIQEQTNQNAGISFLDTDTTLLGRISVARNAGAVNNYSTAYSLNQFSYSDFFWNSFAGGRMTLSANGNLGIGATANPEYRLDLSNNDNDSSYNQYIRFGAYNDGGQDSGGLIWKPRYTGYTKISSAIKSIAEANYFRNGLAFFTNGDASNNTVATERLRISCSGNIGINTQSPTEKLSVSGNASITGNINILGSLSSNYLRALSGDLTNFSFEMPGGLGITNYGGTTMYFGNHGSMPFYVTPSTNTAGVANFKTTTTLECTGTVSLSGKIITNSLTGYSGTVTAGQTMVFTNGILTSTS